MSERGPMAIVEGRHPLMEQLQGSDAFVPNDTYLAGDSLPWAPAVFPFCAEHWWHQKACRIKV